MGNFCHSWDRQKHVSFLSIYHTESSNSAGRSFISASDCCSCVVLHTALPQQCWFCSSALMNFRHSGFEVVVVCLVATQVTLSKPFSAARASGLRGLDAICTFAFHVVFSLSSVSKKNLSGYILKMPKNGCGLANCPRTWCPCSILVNWLIVIFANVFVIFAKINITSTVEMISTDISPNKFQLWDSSDSSRETLRILSYMKSKTRLSFSLKDTKTSILTMKICGTLLAKSPPYQGLASS